MVIQFTVRVSLCVFVPVLVLRAVTGITNATCVCYMRYKRIGYKINVMRQFACLGINQITVYSFASLFNLTPVGRASDSMMCPTYNSLIYLSWLGLDLVLSVAWSFCVQLVVFFCSSISVMLFYTLWFSRCHNTFMSSPHL